MWYVYIIRSMCVPEQEYTGATADLKQREVDSYRQIPAVEAGLVLCAFNDKLRALEFERYLKSHSGRAFARNDCCKPPFGDKSSVVLEFASGRAFARMPTWIAKQYLREIGV